MKQITEKDGVQVEWYKAAKTQTLESLPDFLKHLLTDYGHDYGTICHALAAGAIGTAWAMNHSDQGGISGFQGGAVMWQFVRQWNYESNKTGLAILDYDNLLLPQYADKWPRTVSPETFAAIQALAKGSIEKHEAALLKYQADHAAYELALTQFVSKYPDYFGRKEHYDRLSVGTGGQWAAEDKKVKSGFEFAPQEPYKPAVHPNVLAHWKTLAAGALPQSVKLED